MVVTRKSSSTQPAPPPASRTNSSTASPKARAKKIPVSNEPSLPPAPAVGIAGRKDLQGPEFADPPKIIGSSPLKQAISSGPSPKSTPSKAASMTKTNRKRAAAKRVGTPKRQTSSALKFIRATVLVGLITHSTIVCPHDTNLESPVCSTIHDFSSYTKQYVLEPYVYPRLSEILAHPSVAQVIGPVSDYTYPIVQRISPGLHYGSAKLNQIYLHYLDVARMEIYRVSRPYAGQLEHHYETEIRPVLDRHVVPPYKSYIEPTISQLEQWGRVAGVHAEPYMYRGVVLLQDAGRQAQPHALHAWHYLAQVPAAVQQHAWEPLMDLRRAYVDPPISKILEAVDEVGGEAKPSAASRSESTFMAYAQKTPGEALADDQEVEDEALDGTSASAAFASTPANQATTVSEMNAGTITAEPQATPEEADFDDKHVTTEVDDEDLHAFLQELGDGVDVVEAPIPEAVPEEPRQTETAEEAAERKRLKDAETAEKRAEITLRHENWEREIDALSSTQIAGLPSILTTLRANAILALEGGHHVDALQKDADRALKNTEAFIKKLAGESASSDDKIVLLNGLVSKVKKRFEDGATVMSGNIATWWDNILKAESNEVEKLVKEVRDLGTAAQSDIGLDYAWLDDVTVQDWTRYHNLLNAAKSLQAKLFEISQSSEENALSTALRHLQVELESVVLRFQKRLSDAHDRGLTAIKGDDTKKERSTPSKDEEPTFSVLPVDDGDLDQAVPDHDGVGASHVVLQKTKEQVEDALRMAAQAAERVEL